MLVNRGPVQFNKEHLKCWVAHELFKEHQPAHPQSQSHISAARDPSVRWSAKAHFPRSIYFCMQELMWHKTGCDLPRAFTLLRTALIHWNRHPDGPLSLLKRSHRGKRIPWINQQRGGPAGSAHRTRLTPGDSTKTKTSSRDEELREACGGSEQICGGFPCLNEPYLKCGRPLRLSNAYVHCYITNSLGFRPMTSVSSISWVTGSFLIFSFPSLSRLQMQKSRTTTKDHQKVNSHHWKFSSIQQYIWKDVLDYAPTVSPLMQVTCPCECNTWGNFGPDIQSET